MEAFGDSWGMDMHFYTIFFDVKTKGTGFDPSHMEPRWKLNMI